MAALSYRAPQPGGRSPSRRAGFTLIELLVILVILGMLATMTAITWQSVLPRTELNSAVRELASTISEARSDAIARNAEFSIEYYFEETDSHPRGYRVVTPFRVGPQGGLAVSDEERLARKWSVLPESIFFKSITVDGRRYADGVVTVRFDPLGAASDHLIVLEQQPYENLYTIEVLALTGLVRFHEGEFMREYPRDGDFQ
jgi:prepilin-type N-terminal cleavage/methylation domain-containing protein